MNASLYRRAAVSVLALLPLLASAASAAGDSSEFEALLRTGFSEIRAGAAQSGVPTPPVSPVPAAPFALGGVFLRSGLDGRLAYCSASGCRLLRDGGVGVVVSAGPGALYFTGADTGYCSERRCDILLPGVRVTFPLTVGPKGDIYAAGATRSWHCTPSACAQASAVSLEPRNNFIEGVYKPSGDFVASSSEGTFWCADGACKRVGGGEVLFVEDNCSGTAPAGASYAFSGQTLYRCTPWSCREIGSAESVDNFVSCAFDENSRLLLPARDAARRPAAGSVQVSEIGVVRADAAIPARAKAAPANSSNAVLTGADGATYRIAANSTDAAPAANAPQRLSGKVTRTAGGRTSILSFDLPVTCWQWIDAGDDDEISSGWDGGCRLVR
jgi:hypothetical protein